MTALYEFANGLTRRGHEVHLVHGRYFGCRIDSLDDLDWFHFEPDLVHHIVDGQDIVEGSAALPRADVILSTGAAPELGLPVLLVQGFEMLYPWLERQAFRTPCLKVCIARWLIDVGAAFGVARDQFRIVQMGVDHDQFRPPRPLADRPLQVGMLYNAHAAKGWGPGRAALETVHRELPAVRAAVFGTSVPPEPLPDWITFHLDPGPERLVDEVYGPSRVFLQASDYEGFGFTAVEAMACGSALVTTDNGGSRDYALPDETAVVVPPRDSGAMARAVIGLLTDDDRQVELAAAGERYVRRFDWDLGSAELERHLLDYLAHPAAFRRRPTSDGSEGTTPPGEVVARILASGGGVGSVRRSPPLP